MSFRTRLFLAFTVALLVPLALLAWGVRREVERRLSRQYEQRVEAAVTAIGAELTETGAALADRLDALGTRLAADNRFRLAAVQGDPAARRELIDWAAPAMRLAGLAMFQVQDAEGRILSSGHFRNEYGRARPELPRYLAANAGTPALVRTRTGEGSFVALARVDSITVAGERFTLAGGVAFQGETVERLSTDPELRVRLSLPGSAPSVSDRESVVRELRLPLLDPDAARSDTARLIVVQSAATLADLRRSLDAWFLAALAASAALGLAVAAWLSARVSRPLRDLAARTEAIDLERLDQEFPAERDDEIGTLSRLLGRMMERLRAGTARLREAERRIAMGDLARQVNHDIKNGLVPIRNVLHHLDEVAPQAETLAAVYRERRGTLESSVAYLDTLARNYARLTPAGAREACDVNAVVDEVVRALPAGRAQVRAIPAIGLPAVSADRLALRRILENLVGNAVDSVAGTPGAVAVTTETARRDGGAPVVRITVADQGPGMSRAELDRAFDDFYTTKTGGTGLGLSIVRRLVLDLGGALRIESSPGEGTRVLVDLPAATEGGDTG